MKPFLAGLALFIGMASGGSAATAPTSGIQPVLIRNVTIITMDQPMVVNDGEVLVENGKIRAILRSGEAGPKGAHVIDGKGNFLIPGLIDAHVHFPYGGLAKPANYLRYGVTTVFSLGTPPEELDQLFDARAKIARGELAGPHIYATGPAVANHIKLQKAEEAEPFLSSMRAKGLEFVKIYNEVPQPVFDAVVAGARRRGMGVFGHMPRTFPVEYTISHGLDVLAHMEELFFTTFGGARDRELDKLTAEWQPDRSKIEPVLDLMARNRVAIIANLSASLNFQNLWADEEREFTTSDAKFIVPSGLKRWRETSNGRRAQIEKRMLREQLKYPLIRDLTYRAQQKGILLLAGSDAPLPALFPGRSLHQELRLLVAAGLTNEQALRTATVNGGIATQRFVDREACIGVIRTGCEADLVLVAGSPLDDIRSVGNIKGVMTDGRWYEPAELEQLSRPN